MTKPINDGGPAYPVPEQQFSDGVTIVSKQGHDGMSLRDYFAASSLRYAEMDGWSHNDEKYIAERAYKLADAMIKAREAQS